MAQIEIWLTSGNGKILSVDLTSLIKDFFWESDHIPLVGDNVNIDLDYFPHVAWRGDVGSICGKVVERDFESCSQTVMLTLEIERLMGQCLQRIESRSRLNTSLDSTS
ncbi:MULTISPECIES: hypothetical protein [unclassified Microcoleus]|uniref:hypothetical protein n=1 Tax=unclassified Microcoleus TaxID=2642155 RepID=UPI002601153D|nr:MULTISPECIES: hypothetical protein [unclassified Microcoleus]